MEPNNLAGPPALESHVLLDAHRAVLRFLRARAADVSEQDREDVAGDVIEALITKSATEAIRDASAFAISIAKGKLQNLFRKRDRRAGGWAATDETSLGVGDAAAAAAADADQVEPPSSAIPSSKPMDLRVATHRAKIVSYELAEWARFARSSEASPEDRVAFVERVQRVWREWAATAQAEIRTDLMTALETATGGEPDDEPALIRECFAVLGHDDLAYELPEPLLRQAGIAWRRRRGEKGGIGKYEAVSRLLRSMGDDAAGANPEALKKSWQRTIRLNQGHAPHLGQNLDSSEESGEPADQV